MQIFEEKKCILKADLLKKKSFSSRITYSVKDVNVYIYYTWYSIGKKNLHLTVWYSVPCIFKILPGSHWALKWGKQIMYFRLPTDVAELG